MPKIINNSSKEQELKELKEIKESCMAQILNNEKGTELFIQGLFCWNRACFLIKEL